MEKDKLNIKSQKRLKVLSKIIYILAKIGKIISYVAIPFVVLAMVIVPILMNKIDIQKDKITVKGSNDIINIVDNNDTISISFNDSKIVDITDINDVVKVRDLLDNNSTSSLIVFCEFALVFLLVTIVLSIILLRNLERLFKNINSNNTPFILENVKYIKKIAIILAINIVFPVFSEMILSSILKFDLNISFGTASIIEILIIFSLAYIFEYGCVIQNSSKCRIYSVDK